MIPSPTLAVLMACSGAALIAADGIAAGHLGDRGIADDPRVILATDFEDDAWAGPWGGGTPSTVAILDDDPERGFAPLAGKAMRITVEKGKHYGTSMAYRFRKQGRPEPEEIYFRYYLRFARTWNPQGTNGKLPGIGGTYDRAGWGGRVADGRNGWSARGLFGASQDGRTPVGFYCYHTEMGKWGSAWIWKNEGQGFLEQDRWYCIEQHLRLNTVSESGAGAKDGILRGWVDGQPAFERRDVRFRHVADLKIDRVWIDVYYGGDATPPQDMHLYLDHLVIATDYIGPLATAPVAARPKPEAETVRQKVTLSDSDRRAHLARLEKRLHANLDDGRRPRFRLGLLAGDVTVLGLERGTVSLSIAPQGTRMEVPLFTGWTPTDIANLAVALAGSNQAEDQALAAFFLFAIGEQARAEEHLSQAGAEAEAIRQIFPAE